MSSSVSEIEPILRTAKLYYDGHHYGDLEKLRKAFHKNCHIVGNFEGDLEYLIRDEYLNWVMDQKSPADLNHAYVLDVVSIDVSGTAATVKVADEYLGHRYMDYLSMVKIGDDWVIVCKAYNTEGKVQV